LSKQGQPIPNSALQELQRLFEDTPLDFLGMYLAPAPNHANADWMTMAPQLRNQGWALVPFYVGRQQDSPSTHGLSHIHPATASQEGRNDGSQAVTQARAAQIPQKATLWLDMENSEAFTASTLEYIDAWCDEVAGSQYTPGVYLFPGLAPQLRRHRPNVLMWITRSWYVGADRPVLDDNLDVGGYCWLTPTGQHAPKREPVEMKRPANVPAGGPLAQHWEFVTYPEAIGWQYRTDWTGPNATHKLPRWFDSGPRGDFGMITGAVDLDLARHSDPSATAGSTSKAHRRRHVTGVTASSAAVTGGTTITITVTLDQNVASADSLIILLRGDAPELLLPTSVPVPAKQNQTTVTANTLPVTSTVAVTVSARTRHQLHAPFPSAQINITP
jgi:hypothetical protein